MSYDPGKEIKLELIGALGSDDESLAILFSDQSFVTIHGMSSDGKEVSLFNCTKGFSLNSKAGFPIVRYLAREIVIGMHLSSLETPKFFKASVRIPELSYWFRPSSVERTFLGENMDEGVQVTMHRHKNDNSVEQVSFSTEGGFSISLFQDARYNSDNYPLTFGFEQFVALHIRSTEDTSFLNYFHVVSQYERFLSLATMRGVAYSELCLYSKECYQQIGDKKSYRKIIADAVYHPAPSSQAINIIRFLFSYDTIKEKYLPVINKWFSEDIDFAAIQGHFLESIDYNGVFSYLNFLTVIQAVEGYGHRYMAKAIRSHKTSLDSKQKKNKTELHFILIVLLNSFRDIDFINKDLDIDLIVNTRDYHSHLFSRSKKKIVEGLELYNTTDELRKLLICCILSYLGFTNDDINRIFRASNNKLFQRSLKIATLSQ